MRPEETTLDRMAIDYLMWNYFVDEKCRMMKEPFVLTGNKSREIQNICEKLIKLSDKTIQMCANDPELLDYFNLSPQLKKMFLLDSSCSSGLVRIDCFLTADGWKISELNADVPGALHEGAAFHDLFLPDGDHFQEDYNAVPLYTNYIYKDKPKPTVGIIYATGYADDLEQCQYLRAYWNRQGIPAILGSFANLTFDNDEIFLFGHRLDIIYRFFPVEWIEGLDNIIPFLNAYSKRKFRIANPLSQLLPQNKKIMAFWHDRLNLFTKDEKQLILSYIPKTTLFDPKKTNEYMSRKDEIVIKRSFGRVGEEVLIGMFYTSEEWKEALEWPSLEYSEWIVQERFNVTSATLGSEIMYPCLGVFLVSGRFAGYFTRAAHESFIGYDAFEAPTWIKK